MLKGIRTGSVITLALGLGGIAQAQEQQSERVELEEIVVTATRQVDTVNRVPLSITAVTQEHLDQQGIKDSDDLVRSVPGLATVANPGGGQQTFSIRGIVGGTGAATVGVYLDDTNLTKRSNGGVAQNNGVVVPLLYDLARVEVLKGPQGTLYGGSSQGGTVRYITPTPSLTEFSGSTRLEASSMGSDGELSHEFAGSFGGPLVEDKFGFRVSGIRRETGGWVDLVSGYRDSSGNTGQMIEEDANSETEWAGRVAFLWQVSENVRAQLSGYHTDYESEGGPSTTTKIFVDGDPVTAGYQGVAAPQGITFTTASRCITNNTRPTSGTIPNPPGTPPATPQQPYRATAVPGQPGASAFVPGNATCTAPSGTTVFFREGRQYGPFYTGEYVNIATGRQGLSPAGSESDIAALTFDFDFGGFTVKSITSYLKDEGFSSGPGGEEWGSSTPPTTINNINGTAASVSGATGQSLVGMTQRGFPLFEQFFLATGQGHSQIFAASNERDGIEQEFRVSSVGDGRLSWVTGAYFSDADTNIHYENLIAPATSDLVQQLMYGPTFSSLGRYGVPNTDGNQGFLDADINDKEYAVFGEANYWLIEDKLKAIAGLRYSKLELDYYQLAFGQTNGRTALSEGSITQGKLSEKPLTPKVGLQYQLTEDRSVYATASKGFRAGGVNAEVSQTICATALQNIGLTAAELPDDYETDTVWSYELGGKFRVLDNLQVNVAAFRIDWDDVQATTTLSCGQSFTSNGGSARSEGGEIQVQYQPLDSLGLYLNASYTDAYYVDPVQSPLGAGATVIPAPSFNAGDKFNIPPFQLSVGGQFDFMIGDLLSSYIRLDGTYSDDYTSGATFGSSGYAGNFFLKDKPQRTLVNLRAGVRMDNGLEVNAFVQNLLNNEDQIVAGLSGFGDGRAACTITTAAPDCSTFGTYNPFVNQAFLEPRRYGLQMNYKF